MSVEKRICNACGKKLDRCNLNNRFNKAEASCWVETPNNKNKKEPLCWLVKFSIAHNSSDLDICDPCALKQFKKAGRKLTIQDINNRY